MHKDVLASTWWRCFELWVIGYDSLWWVISLDEDYGKVTWAFRSPNKTDPKSSPKSFAIIFNWKSLKFKAIQWSKNDTSSFSTNAMISFYLVSPENRWCIKPEITRTDNWKISTIFRSICLYSGYKLVRFKLNAFEILKVRILKFGLHHQIGHVKLVRKSYVKNRK